MAAYQPKDRAPLGDRRYAANRLRAAAESPFIRNKYGLWCPNCQEQIDEFWPESCDHCGYPAPDHEHFDDEDLG